MPPQCAASRLAGGVAVRCFLLLSTAKCVTGLVASADPHILSQREIPVERQLAVAVHADGSTESPLSRNELVRAHRPPAQGRHQVPQATAVQLPEAATQLKDEVEQHNGWRDVGIASVLEKLRSNSVLGLQRQDVWPPPSVAMFIGAAASALVAVLFVRLSVFFSKPSPWAEKRIQLQAEIEEQRERTVLLQTALRKKEEEQERQAQQPEADGHETEETPPQQPAAQSYDELMGEVLHRTREPERVIADLTGEGLKQAAPLVGRAAHTVNVIQEQIQGSRAKAESLVADEAARLMESVQNALGATGGAQSLALPGWLQGNGGTSSSSSEAQPPVIMLMLNGLLAPAFLRALQASTQLAMYWYLVLLSLCVGILVTDWTKHCTDWMVWTWILGMTSFYAVQCWCNGILRVRCSQALLLIKDAELEWESSMENTGNPIWDAYISMKSGGGFFFMALCRYESVTSCVEYNLSKMLGLGSMVLGVLGVYLTCANVVSDVARCDANLVLFFMHINAFFFVLLFFFHVVALGLWLVQQLSGCSFVTVPLLKLAKKMDKDVPFQIPIYVLLVRTFLLRNSSDILKIKADALSHSIEVLEAEHKVVANSVEAVEKKLAMRRAEMVRTFEEHLSARDMEDEMVQKYRESIGQHDAERVDLTSEGARRVVEASSSSTA
mmetsp:Transcript_54410/g.129669  ORF Transcript_54410/g.129669 Transcript_54410/m.129669 type:complete len:668 (-) Transcript_54410:81-2084(-)